MKSLEKDKYEVIAETHLPTNDEDVKCFQKQICKALKVPYHLMGFDFEEEPDKQITRVR